MAGRLYIEALAPGQWLADVRVDAELIASPNLAPRNWLSLLRHQNGEVHLGRAFWGFTPSWLEVLDHAMHCARAESLEERAMFREALATRRCLVPVSGVYIWKSLPRGKQPFLVTRTDRAPFLLAGLWCRYFSDIHTAFDSMALITTTVDMPLTPLTDRFPVVIDAARAHAWLDPATPPASARELLAPAAPALLGAFPVERLVNNPANQQWHCARPTGHMMTATHGAVRAE
ncbi:SOS response-associated peptidase [Kushneria aurantia]|uniref:Abasic site processing protein n=1 Tax=Kushneria aurantia TaxID=504092 RepID=A0ABV6G7E2_9GAMM|nr:SOS response-associated peptidase family protein [Kushneria aurantia]